MSEHLGRDPYKGEIDATSIGDEKVVDGSNGETDGEEKTEVWPEALDRDEFSPLQQEVIEYLTLHPKATQSEVEKNTNGSGSVKYRVRQKVSRMVDQDAVNFPIPEKADDGVGASDQTREILGRREILGQSWQEISNQLGVSEAVVRGSMNAKNDVSKSDYIVPDDAEVPESRATDESDDEDVEGVGSEKNAQASFETAETPHDPVDETPDGGSGDKTDTSEAVLGVVLMAVLLWIGYRIGRWRAGGER